MADFHKTDLVIFTGFLFIPLPSIQHFIWPLSWCLLADICNHTWIPECGEDLTISHHRIFIDECDMFEYNCDNELDYYVVNYTDCFLGGPCPTAPPCATNPTCKEHDHFRRTDPEILKTAGRRNVEIYQTLPQRMLSGKRRYTPGPRKRRLEPHNGKKRKKPIVKKTTQNFKTVIVKRETIFKNGKKMMRVVKALAYNAEERPLNIIEEDSDFIE